MDFLSSLHCLGLNRLEILRNLQNNQIPQLCHCEKYEFLAWVFCWDFLSLFGAL